MEWSEEDIDYLVLACQDGESTIKEVADFLGRSVASLRSKIKELRESGAYPDLVWGMVQREERDRLIKRHYGKIPMAELCEMTGVGYSSLYFRAERFGLVRHNHCQNLFDLTVEKVTALAEKGLTRQEIARELGVSYDRVRRFIAKHKIPCVISKRRAFRVKLT